MSGGTWFAKSSSVTSIEPRLRYLDANHVDTPAGRLDGAVLVSPAKVRLGTLEGILVDPQHRQVRYYVVARKRGLFSSRHYLLPLTATRLDRDRHTLEVDVEADEIPQLAEVDPDDLPRFSDDDLLMAMFHSNVS
jgi:PRC-barrel domain